MAINIYIYKRKSRIAPWFFQLIYRVVSAEMVKGSEEEDVSWGGGERGTRNPVWHILSVRYLLNIQWI